MLSALKSLIVKYYTSQVFIFLYSKVCNWSWMHNWFIFRNLSFLTFLFWKTSVLFASCTYAHVCGWSLLIHNSQLLFLHHQNWSAFDYSWHVGEPVDYTTGFTDGCFLFKAFKTRKRLANALHYIKRSKRSKSSLLVFCYKQLGWYRIHPRSRSNKYFSLPLSVYWYSGLPAGK